MNTLLQADIFFFITSIAVVVLVILVSIALFYLIRILRDVSYITDTVRQGVDNASTHIEELVDRIMENRFFSFIFRKKKASHKNNKKEEK
ncbi:MAG: hypothetical protein M3Q34_02810 [bacterium]|nr:hypothetical protein [bacterium]